MTPVPKKSPLRRVIRHQTSIMALDFPFHELTPEESAQLERTRLRAVKSSAVIAARFRDSFARLP